MTAPTPTSPMNTPVPDVHEQVAEALVTCPGGVHLTKWPISHSRVPLPYCGVCWDQANRLADAVLAVPAIQAALALAAEAETRVEWGVRHLHGFIQVSDQGTAARLCKDWPRQTRQVVRRTVTTYPPVVGEWEPVDDAADAGGEDRE